jgi:glycosyltransferase involved in cell wall biosynthesis
MRIAYFSQSYYPMVSGLALMVRRVAEGMAARGHTVLVVAASDKGPAYTELTHGVTVARLRSYPNPFRVGQRFLLWPGGALRAALERFRPAVVHCHDFSQAGAACLQLANQSRIPAALTLHQLPWFITTYLPRIPGLAQIVEPSLWRYLRRLARSCAAVISPSEMMARLTESHLGQPVQAITNGVALDRFSPTPAAPDEGATLRERYGLPSDLPILLFVGRLDADKRVDWLLRAAARALQTVPAQIVIAGDGKLRPALERLSATLGLGARCHFIGYVSADGDLPALYRAASVFCTASTVEIQSSVVLEAFASGLPVVTVRASSMAEYVSDGVNGYLAPPDDIDALAAQLARVLGDADRCAALRDGALRVAARHSVPAALDAHEALYQQLIRPASQSG